MRSSEIEAHVGDEHALMAIGAVAGRFGLAAHVLRHWEEMGLLAPARDAVGHRRYSTTDLARVAVILRAKEAGLPLEAIRSLVIGAGTVARRDALKEQAEALRSRIAAAQASLELVECALTCDRDDHTQCTHYQQAVAEGLAEDAAVPDSV